MQVGGGGGGEEDEDEDEEKLQRPNQAQTHTAKKRVIKEESITTRVRSKMSKLKTKQGIPILSVDLL